MANKGRVNRVKPIDDMPSNTIRKGKKSKSLSKSVMASLGMSLTINQEEFCQLYTSREFFGNGVWAYAEAFDIDIESGDQGKKNVCAARSSVLLKQVNILNRINQLLDDQGLNDAFVDKQLLFLITQNADLGAKLRAITVYNDLRNRITRKLDITINPIEKMTDEELDRELQTIEAVATVMDSKQLEP